MNPRSSDGWLACILLTMGICAPLPLYAQSAPHHFSYGAQPRWAAARAPGWAAGVGARFNRGPIFAGALIGGIIGHALSFPHEHASAPHYGTVYRAPNVQGPESSLEPPRRAASRAPSIADGWTQIGEVPREGPLIAETSRSQFAENWQRFFEPSAKTETGPTIRTP